MAFRPVIPNAPRYQAGQTMDFSPLERGIDSGIRRNTLLEQRDIEKERFEAQQEMQREQMAATAAHRNAMLGQSAARMKMAQANADRTFGLQQQRFGLQQQQMAFNQRVKEAELMRQAQRREMMQNFLRSAGGMPAQAAAPQAAAPVAPPQEPAPAPAPPGVGPANVATDVAAAPAAAVAPQQSGGGQAGFVSPQGMNAIAADYLFNGGKDIGTIIQNDATKSLTPAQKAIDSSFGQEYAEFVKDGRQTIEKNLEQLQFALREMREADVSGLTAGFAANNPMIGTTINPRAVETKNAVEEVVQQNLRAILGGQFAQQEASQLIERAYQPYADEKDNIRRVARLERAIRKGYQQKLRMAAHFEENGTLKGFKGTQPTMASIMKDAGLPPSNNVRQRASQSKQQDLTYTTPDGRNFVKKDGKWFEQ